MQVQRSEDNLMKFIFSSSTFMWVPGIELRLPGLFGKRLYLLSHLASPENRLSVCYVK